MNIPDGLKPVLSLVLMPNGQLGLVGPVDDLVKTYGLIGIMRDLAQAHHAAKQENAPSVVPASAAEAEEAARRADAARAALRGGLNGGSHA